jgi:hypothetical protein
MHLNKQQVVIMRPPLKIVMNLMFVASIFILLTSGWRISMKTSLIVDMHYGILIGAGWTSADYGNISVATTTAAVSAGSYDIPVSGNFGLNVGILATYQAADGQWYAFKIRSSSSTLLQSDRPLQAIASGATIGNVYKNDAHPNDNGGKMIVDAMLRELSDPILGRARNIERIYRDTDAWSSFNASVSFSVVSDYNYPGADMIGERAAVASGYQPGGVISPSVSLMGGDYIVKIPVNTGSLGGGANTVTVLVEQQQDDGTFLQVASRDYIGFAATYLAEVPFHDDGSKAVRVKAVSVGGTASWNFMAGQIEFDRVVGPTINVTTGKIVLLADSWGTPAAPGVVASPIAQALTSRLTGATLAIKGVAGNRSDQLISRFATDVTTETPDIVLVIVGTNDFYQSITPAAFEANLATLKNMILAIGAQPIFLTPSVGAITYSPSQLFPSRQYESYVRFLDYNQPSPLLSYPLRLLHAFEEKFTVPAGQSRDILVSPGVTKTAAFMPFMSCDNPNLTVDVGFDVGGTMQDAQTFNPSQTVRKWWLNRPPSALAGFLTVTVNNDTATDQTATLNTEIAWNGDLS